MQPQSPPPYDPRQPPGVPPQAPQPPQVYTPQTSGQNQSAPLPAANPYEFIVNPTKPSRPSLFAGADWQKRVLAIGLGLIGLIIIGTVFSKLLGGSDNAYPLLLGITQEQQELIHLTTDDIANQTSLSTSNTNLAATTDLTVSSAQGQLITYLGQNGHKVNPKLLGLKESSTTDLQLTDATSAGTFDTTYQSVMQTELNTYMQLLKQAYAQEKGPNGRKLLSGDYSQAQLLLKLLGSPTS